jgi:hypothetical protein
LLGLGGSSRARVGIGITAIGGTSGCRMVAWPPGSALRTRRFYAPDLRFRVEAMGLEPTNLLTASHILGVREGSSSADTGSLPGVIVQSRSDRFSGIRSRCLHNCLHLLARHPLVRRPVGLADGILPGRCRIPPSARSTALGLGCPSRHHQRTVRRGRRGILSPWLRNR